jgi:hypothetical protein
VKVLVRVFVTLPVLLGLDVGVEVLVLLGELVRVFVTLPVLLEVDVGVLVGDEVGVLVLLDVPVVV